MGFHNPSIHAEPLSPSQKEELRKYGDITVNPSDPSEEPQMYHVRYIPGTASISAFSSNCRKEGLGIAIDTLSEENLSWCKDFFIKQMRFTANCVHSCRENLTDDFQKTIQNVAQTQGNLGTKAIAAVYCGTKFTGSLLVNALATLFGSAWGIASSLIVPTVNLVGKPAVGGCVYIAGGVIAPAIAYPWTHVATLAKQIDQIPTGADTLITKYSELERRQRMAWRERQAQR